MTSVLEPQKYIYQVFPWLISHWWGLRVGGVHNVILLTISVEWADPPATLTMGISTDIINFLMMASLRVDINMIFTNS